MIADLAVHGVTKRYGTLAVIDGVSLEVRDEVLGVIGPNGAGKTTLFGIMAGQVRPDEGTVAFLGTDVTSVSAHVRARMGLARTFQVPQPFRGMSVEENLVVGGLLKERSVANAQKRSAAILEIVGWRGDLRRKVEELGEIDLKRLEVARALTLEPRVLLLDEVFAGLTGPETEEMMAVVRSLRGTVPSIVIVEHVMAVVRSLCSRLVVLDAGSVLVEGEVGEVLADRRTVETYLGA